METASFSFPALGKEKIQWTARPCCQKNGVVKINVVQRGYAQICKKENLKL